MALVHQCEAAAVASVGAKLPFKRDTNTNTNTNTNNTDTNKQQVGSKLSEKMVPLLSSSILGAADRHPTPCHALTSNCNYKYRKKYKYQLKRKYKYKKKKIQIQKTKKNTRVRYCKQSSSPIITVSKWSGLLVNGCWL